MSVICEHLPARRTFFAALLAIRVTLAQESTLASFILEKGWTQGLTEVEEFRV